MDVFGFVVTDTSELVLGPEELTETREVSSVAVVLSYRVIVHDVTMGNWHDEVFLHATLVRGPNSEVVFDQRISMFDFSTTPVPRRYDQTRTKQVGPVVLAPGAYSLSLTGKYAGMGILTGYVVFAGACQIFLDGQLAGDVRYIPSQQKPIGEETRVLHMNRK